MFKELAEISDFTLIAGTKSPYNNIVVDSDYKGYEVCSLKNVFLFKGRHKLTFQLPTWNFLKLIFNSRDAHFIFLGVDPHIVSSIFYFIFFKVIGYKVSWWGHGKLGNGLVGKVRFFLFKLSYRIIVYGNNAEVLLNPKLKNKVRIIGNTMNWEDYKEVNENINKKNDSKEGIKLLFTGRIVPSKKLHVLLEACSKLKIKYKLVVIGKGEHTKKYKMYSDKKHLNVKFNGEIYGKEVKDLMNWADVMVIPGKVGLSLVHAYGNNLPVIMHDSLDLHSPEYEIHTMNESFLFKKDDSSNLANKINDIFSGNLIQEESKNCKESILKYGYFPDVVATKFLNSLK